MDKFALLFPGQGSQYVGMGKSLCEQYPAAKQVFEEANDVLEFDIMKMCFEGYSFELNKVENALPAILITSVAAFRAYMSEIGVKPFISAGHSLGEYTALTCSGAVSFADTLKIVRLRSILAAEISNNLGGGMTIANDIDVDIVESACREVSDDKNIASIACYNSPTQFVISGHQNALIRLEDILMEKDAQITPLLMSPPFHSVLMKDLTDRLRSELERIEFNAFNWPVLSNVKASQFESRQEILESLSSQAAKPVRWREILINIREKNINTFIEIGPQSVLKDLTRKNLADVRVYSYTQINDKNEILNMFKSDLGINSKSSRSYEITVVTKCLAAAVSTKNSNWDSNEYEKGVVIPFREVQDIQMMLQKENKLPTIEQMYKALNMLKSVLDTKKVPEEKKIKIFDRILDETRTRELLKDFKVI